MLTHMPRISRAPLSPPDVARVAVAASVDPRTVESYLRGGRLLPATLARVEDALRAAGHARLVRGGDTGPAAA